MDPSTALAFSGVPSRKIRRSLPLHVPKDPLAQLDASVTLAAPPGEWPSGDEASDARTSDGYLTPPPHGPAGGALVPGLLLLDGHDLPAGADEEAFFAWLNESACGEVDDAVGFLPLSLDPSLLAPGAVPLPSPLQASFSPAFQAEFDISPESVVLSDFTVTSPDFLPITISPELGCDWDASPPATVDPALLLVRPGSPSASSGAASTSSRSEEAERRGRDRSASIPFSVDVPAQGASPGEVKLEEDPAELPEPSDGGGNTFSASPSSPPSGDRPRANMLKRPAPASDAASSEPAPKRRGLAPLGPRAVVCDHPGCGEVIGRKWDLPRHKLTAHPGAGGAEGPDLRVWCDVCERFFSRDDSYRRHLGRSAAHRSGAAKRKRAAKKAADEAKAAAMA